MIPKGGGGLVAASLPDAFIVNRGVQASSCRSGAGPRFAGLGLVVDLDDSGSAFGKQFKRADRSGARWALVLGDEEAERGEVRLKPTSAVWRGALPFALDASWKRLWRFSSAVRELNQDMRGSIYGDWALINLVTGGAGFVGSHLIDRLMQAGMR